MKLKISANKVTETFIVVAIIALMLTSVAAKGGVGGAGGGGSKGGSPAKSGTPARGGSPGNNMVRNGGSTTTTPPIVRNGGIGAGGSSSTSTVPDGAGGGVPVARGNSGSASVARDATSLILLQILLALSIFFVLH